VIDYGAVFASPPITVGYADKANWVSEDCSGRLLPEEENCGRIQPGGEVMAITNAEPVAEKSLDLEAGVSGASLTAVEVAKLLKVHPTTVYRMATRRKLPAFKIAGEWRFDRVEFESWMKSHVERWMKSHVERWMKSHVGT
jgi:excisionase family DNA binding protein